MSGIIYIPIYIKLIYKKCLTETIGQYTLNMALKQSLNI